MPMPIRCEITPVRLSNGRRAYLFIPVEFYEADKPIIKSYIDAMLGDEPASPPEPSP